MNFWVKFAIEEALTVVAAFLAANKTKLTPAQVAALETYIQQTEALLAVF